MNEFTKEESVRLYTGMGQQANASSFVVRFCRKNTSQAQHYSGIILLVWLQRSGYISDNVFQNYCVYQIFFSKYFFHHVLVPTAACRKTGLFGKLLHKQGQFEPRFHTCTHCTHTNKAPVKVFSLQSFCQNVDVQGLRWHGFEGSILENIQQKLDILAL